MTIATHHDTGWSTGLRAGFWPRFVAALIDGLIVGIPVGILNVTLRSQGYWLGLLIGVAYFTYFRVARPGPVSESA
jgi:hypothetical protein